MTKPQSLWIGEYQIYQTEREAWVFLDVCRSPMRFVMAPLVLTGITVVVYRLVRGHRNAWAMSAFAAVVISLGSLSLAAWMSDRETTVMRSEPA